MYHARRKQLPALPKTRNEVHEYIESANLTTSAGDPFLLINNKNNGLIVFATFLNFHFLANCDTVYMDGIFNYCTQFFYQFFTIHGYHNGFYIPLLFCLLPGKQHENYLILFNSIKTKAELNGLVFQPSKIVVDFELAIHSALREVWQDAEIIGCRFHLGQAWFRKIQSLGLASEFNNPNSDIGKHLKYFFGLSFLEPLVVSDGFLLLLEDMPQDERITKFCDYLVENYIKEDALFPPELWAAASWSLSRTTNACESFHSHFADNFYRSHPNIFQFINVLLDIQLTTSAKISSARKGRKLVRAQYRRTEQLLRTKTEEYTSNRISMLDFIKYMAYRFTSHPRM